MRLKVTHNDRLLSLVESSKLERKQLSKSLTKKLEYHRYLPKNVKDNWNGIITYFHNDKYIPIGLWKYVLDECKKYNFDLHIEGISNVFTKIDKDSFLKWVDYKLEDHYLELRDYQIDTVFKILNNRFSISELATSAGKSFIIFLVISYLIDHNMSNKVLMIVPSINLVIQAYEDFNKYNQGIKADRRSNWTGREGD